MSKRVIHLGLTVVVLTMMCGAEVTADVKFDKGGANQIVTVLDDPWQPEGFVNGITIPAAWMQKPDVIIDGADNEAAWSLAKEVEVSLDYGTVERAWLKALYTDDEVFIRVRWEDATEDRQHHPWVWDEKQGQYVAGSQVEDSIMLSFEAGCEWTPRMLGGYIYDFDAWHWLAGRSDPLGQALDLYGNVQDRDTKIVGFEPYQSRITEDDWILKFGENHDVDLHAAWDEIDRIYMLQPVTRDLWVKAVPDGGRRAPPFVEQLPAPLTAPSDPEQTFPQFSPVRLTGSAAEVAARGQWQDGQWVVEFRRLRFTPADHIFDTVFNRLIQFSVQIFDQVEGLDKSSESGRLFLHFLQPEQRVAAN